MKITQQRDSNTGFALTTSDIDTFVLKVQTETKAQPVSAFREQLKSILPGMQITEANKLPRILPAAEFRKVNNQKQLKAYNGIVELTVGPLSGKAEIALVKRLAWEQPQTRLVFVGSSGRTVKIWTTFTRPDNTLPTSHEAAETFHAHAYRLAVKCYQPQIPFDILLKEPTLEQYSRLSFDPELLYRPDSIQFYLAQPVAMPDEQSHREVMQTEKIPLERAVPGYETEEACIMLFEAAVQKTYIDLTEAENNGADPVGQDLQPIVTCLAENCFRSGIPEEEAVKRTIFHYYTRMKGEVIRRIVRAVYQECKGFGKQCSMSKEQQLALQMDEFMKRRYDFRYNTQVGEVEYRERHSFRFRFLPIDKRVLNSIALDAQHEGIPLWDRDVNRYIYSNRVPVFNPLTDYLYNLSRWDGQDRIGLLAQTVPCSNPHWPALFHRWFLNMVAHWRGNADKRFANNVSPLLVGAQGTRKSTFCRNLVPPELRNYYTDSIDFSRKRDAELYLNRFALINIDEFDQISPTQQGFLKHILQKPVVNVRKPYANAVLEMQRYASFIATSNQMDLLTDPSGSRRFICIEVTDVINTGPIDYNQLYAQAMHEIDNGERYWFDQLEEQIMTEYNRAFEQVLPEEQLFDSYFRVAENEDEGEWLSPAEILSRLKKRCGIPLSSSKVHVFGRMLRKHEIPSKRSRFGIMYHVVERAGKL
ncbi:BT4734/BF3469 family protein [Bacteroides sp. 519]|uniref:BT4734/BF3469 family protein n=1 Tax=Bacteroides sp. 519 TaxID=2302937 RepID=UPI0013D703CB|nr:BT4734/BF3469 family protein [Bacteroides sp. 519]NDV60318.1 helicase [Bacteroides sp. 519]